MVMNMRCVLLNNLIVVFKFLSLIIALAYMHVLLFVKLVQGTWDIVQWQKNPAAVKKLFCRPTKFYYQFGLAGWVGGKNDSLCKDCVSIILGKQYWVQVCYITETKLMILYYYSQHFPQMNSSKKSQDSRLPIYSFVNFWESSKGHSLTYHMTSAYPN
jgi:hypothetical protein